MEKEVSFISYNEMLKQIEEQKIIISLLEMALIVH